MLAVEIKILFDPQTGAVNVAWSVPNDIMFWGIWKKAEEAIEAEFRKQATQGPKLALPNGPLPPPTMRH
jgi:hypothetical protein